MKLHGSPNSPYVRKARVSLIEAGVSFEFKPCDVWGAESLIASMNPLGKVPVLETGDGEPVFDSFAIIDCIDRISGAQIIPSETQARRGVLWWHALAHGMIDAAVVEVLERRRPRERQSEEQVERERRRMGRALDAAEARLHDGDFIQGPRLTLADIALAVALEYLDFRISLPWRDDHPKLAAWLAKTSQRPSLVETVPPQPADS